MHVAVHGFRIHPRRTTWCLAFLRALSMLASTMASFLSGTGILATLASKGKALMMNMTDWELKTFEATNEDAWGPAGNAMAGGSIEEI